MANPNDNIIQVVQLMKTPNFLEERKKKKTQQKNTDEY